MEQNSSFMTSTKTAKIEIVHINAVSHVAMVQHFTRQLQENMQNLHELIGIFGQQLDQMNKEITFKNQEIQSMLKPMLRSISESLDMGIIQQKQENNHLQKQILDLRRDQSELSRDSNQTEKSWDSLTSQVGKY